MNFKFSLRKSDISKDFRAPLSPVQTRRVLGRMASVFSKTVAENFGLRGVDRPVPWPSVTQKYSKRVKRGQSTLDTDVGVSPYSDGRATGRLHRSIRIRVSDTSASVYTNDPIAEVHQFGLGRMPKRPFFPMYDNGTPTPSAKARMMAAGQQELDLISQRKLPSAIY